MKAEYKTKINQQIEIFLNEQKNKSFFASDILEFMDKNSVQVNQATIYRNLDKLVEKNRLIRFKSSESSRCMYRIVAENIDCHKHLHIRCCICGKIIHLEDDETRQFIDYISSKYGFEMDYDDSVLQGICSKCKKQ